MGNTNLISALKRGNYIPIEDKGVTFFEGRFHAEYIFQRHNFQMYRVRDTTVQPGEGCKSPQTYYLRIINSLNDDDSIAIIEHMQQTLIQISHPNLVQYFAIAVEQERPHIKFVILEEDLTDYSISIRTLLDTICSPQNRLVALYFQERQYIYEFILQALQALAFLNANGKTFGELHGDLSPMSIVLKFTEETSSFQVKILDYLKIRDLVEIAQQQSQLSDEGKTGTLVHTMLSDSSSPRLGSIVSPDSKKNMIQKSLPYDAPERIYVNQKEIGLMADVWSLGVVLYEFLVTPDGNKKQLDSVSELRLVSYEARVKLIEENVADVAMRELLLLMLRDHETRPTAELLIENPLLQSFTYIVSQNISLDQSGTLNTLCANNPIEVFPTLVSALQMGDKNKAIVSFFALMRALMVIQRTDVKTRLQEFVLKLVLHQKAYIQIVELLVICMKEYSVSQSNCLAPLGRDSFADLYVQALHILVRTLEQGCIHVPSSLMRSHVYLAGLLSLTMLLCEQVNRIASAATKQVVEPIPAEDQEYLSITLKFLIQFAEQSSPTALIAAEKAGIVRNLIKVLSVKDPVGFISKETHAGITFYLAKTANLMPVALLKEVTQNLSHLNITDYLCQAPVQQMTKQVYKRFVLDQLTTRMLKASLQNYQLEQIIAKVIYFCSYQRTLHLANAFHICTESLKLNREVRAFGINTKYDFGYLCLTCTDLLEGLHEYHGPRKVIICYSCAQLCHAKHSILPTGYMNTTWTGCKCQLVQGFQVGINMLQTAESADAPCSEMTFHACRARQEPMLTGGLIRPELSQPQLKMDPNLLENSTQQVKVRKSSVIIKINAEPVDDIYTTESLDVQSICSVSPLVNDGKEQQQSGVLSPVSTSGPNSYKKFVSRTMPIQREKETNQTPQFFSASLSPTPIDTLINQDHLSQESITTIADQVKGYFECKIMLGGFYDQVAIGLTNDPDFPVSDTFVGYVPGSIGFHGDDGKCYNNGESFEYTSPYGAQSTVGCGVTTNGDVFFTRDGFQLPMIRSSAIWPNPDAARMLYPVVSMRGKLATVKVSFRTDGGGPCVFKPALINPSFDNPVDNISMDTTMLRMIATELPMSQLIVDTIKLFIQSSDSSIESSLIQDFYQRIVAIKNSEIMDTRGIEPNMTKKASGTTINTAMQMNLSSLSIHQKQVPKTTTSKQQNFSSKLKFHYPNTTSQQQNFSLGSTTSQQKRDREISQQRQTHSTVSPRSVRLQQTSSLSQLQRQAQIAQPGGTIDEIDLSRGGSLQRQQKTTQQKSQASHFTTTLVKGTVAGAGVGTKQRMTTSSIEQRSKDEQRGGHMTYSGTLKGSRSTTNLGPNAPGSRVASKTALRKPGISIANQMLQSFTSKQQQQQRQGANSRINQAQSKRGVKTAAGIATSKTVKHSQQLILAGSTNNQSILAEGAAASAIIDLTKPGSLEMSADKMSIVIEGGAGAAAASNYYSAQNPQSSFLQQEQSQSLSNLRIGMPGLAQSTSNSSLLATGAVAAKKQQVNRPGSKLMNQTASLSNLLGSQQRQKSLLRHTSSPKTLPHSGIVRQQQLYQHNSAIPQHRQAQAAGDDYVDQPITIQATGGENKGSHVSAFTYGQRNSGSLVRADRAGKPSQASIKSKQDGGVSMTKKSPNGPSVFYQAYTNSAQTMPRATHHIPSSNKKSSSSSNRVMTSQVHKPVQNVSTSVSIKGNHTGEQTKAHQLKPSYVKVPKPRLTSEKGKNLSQSKSQAALMAANVGSTSKPTESHGTALSNYHGHTATSQMAQQSMTRPNSQYHTQTVMMKPSSSQKILGNARPFVQQSKQQKFNFYPQLAGNLDISIPGSELNCSAGNQAEIALQRSNRFAKDDSNLLDSSRRTANRDSHDGDSQAKNCSIF